jgi:hypothetical protein
MGIKYDRKVDLLEDRMDKLEALVSAVRKDIESLREDKDEPEAYPGLRIPAFPRALRELGFDPPEAKGDTG